MCAINIHLIKDQYVVNYYIKQYTITFEKTKIRLFYCIGPFRAQKSFFLAKKAKKLVGDSKKHTIFARFFEKIRSRIQ